MTNALIVLNYNDYQNTLRLVNEVKQYVCIQQIVIVDNCSTDDSYVKLCNYFCNNESIHIIKTSRNGGYAFGNNYGYKYAIDFLDADFLTFANPDISFEENVLTRMIDVLKRKEDVACVAPLMVCDLPNQSPVAWRLPGFFDCLLDSTLILSAWYRKRVLYTEEYFDGDKVVPVEVVSGSFFSIKSEVMKDLNGFDEDTFLYFEENILAWKTKNKGYSNYILTDVCYKHFSSESIDASIPSRIRKLEIADKSRDIYLSKCCGASKKMLFMKNIFSCMGRMLYSLIYANR